MNKMFHNLRLILSLSKDGEATMGLATPSWFDRLTMGADDRVAIARGQGSWIPAFAGMTAVGAAGSATRSSFDGLRMRAVVGAGWLSAGALR